jgi:NADPH:quinone reductase-like Zn-dependent oxidoreductase
VIFLFVVRNCLRAGQKVLIYGASGTSGVIAVQYAKYLGGHVTAVCGTKNVDFGKSFGANTVIDYTLGHPVGADEKYDFILDSVGKRKTSELTCIIGYAELHFVPVH